MKSDSKRTATCKWKPRPPKHLSASSLHGIFVAYPLELAARLESDLPWLAHLWEIDWRGTRLCCVGDLLRHASYEQLQYIGDTRIQAPITLYMGRDDHLVRQAIEHFNLSRIPEGITASRYPSDLGQYIPTFSLVWVAMVHDYWITGPTPRTSAASCRGYGACSPCSRSGSARPACSGRSPGGPKWIGRRAGAPSLLRAATGIQPAIRKPPARR